MGNRSKKEEKTKRATKREGLMLASELLEEEIRAYYGGGRSRHFNLRLSPAMIVAISDVERSLSKTAGRAVSRAAAGRAMIALGLAYFRRDLLGDRVPAPRGRRAA